MLNRTCPPSDVIAYELVCRLCHRLTARDLSKIMALRRSAVSSEALPEWDAELLSVTSDHLRKHRLRKQ